MKIETFSKCENRFDFQIRCHVKTKVVFIGRFWLLVRTFRPFFKVILITNFHWPVLTKNQIENWCQFLADKWKLPNIG
jgi:hypothetical protein